MNKINTRPVLKMTIGNYITLEYEDPLVVDTKTGKGFYTYDEELPGYKAQGFKIIKGFWMMTLKEPDGTINRFWTSSNLRELLLIARQGNALFIHK